MSIKLSNSHLEKDAIRAPHFFNGRLLSAEDMTAERTALLRKLAQVGRATGDGIAYGLEVSGVIGGSSDTDPVVTVEPGLAINREGFAIELNQSVDVSLLEPASSAPAALAQRPSDGGFGVCGESLGGTAYASGRGVYLLTIAPAEGREGRAMTSGLGNLTVCCGDKSVVEGVQFRLIRLDVSPAEMDEARVRNRVAHRCFGSGDSAFAEFTANPFGVPPLRYGLVDALRDGRLSDWEVPLAVLHWVSAETSGGRGTRFIDTWAVRRRVVRPGTPGRWQPFVGDRRAAEQEAMFEQFQDEIAEVPSAERARFVATDHFDYLPPAGVLPLAFQSTDGFTIKKFFSGIKTRSEPLYVEASRVRWLLRMAAEFPPIDLTTSLGKSRLVWHYLVDGRRGGSGSTAKPYLVFVRGDVPYVGDPHYDANHWDFSNYAIGSAKKA
ncbi:MAG TPA: hypothetical protein VGK73_03470 [Polyangiaceae bacterium]